MNLKKITTSLLLASCFTAFSADINEVPNKSAIVLYKEPFISHENIRKQFENMPYNLMRYEHNRLVLPHLKDMQRDYYSYQLGKSGVILRSEIFSNELAVNSKGKISEHGTLSFSSDGETFFYYNTLKNCIELHETNSPETVIKRIGLPETKDKVFNCIDTTYNPKYVILSLAEHAQKKSYTKPILFLVDIETGNPTQLTDNDLPYASLGHVYLKKPNKILIEFSGQKTDDKSLLVEPYRFKWVEYDLDSGERKELGAFSKDPGDIVFDENENPVFSIYREVGGEQVVYKLNNNNSTIALESIHSEGKSAWESRRIKSIDPKTGDIYIASRRDLDYWTPIKRTKGPFSSESPLLPDYVERTNIKHFGKSHRKDLFAYKIFEDGRNAIKIQSTNVKINRIADFIESAQDDVFKKTGGELTIEAASSLENFAFALREKNPKSTGQYAICKVSGSGEIQRKQFNPFKELPFKQKLSDVHSVNIEAHDGKNMSAFLTEPKVSYGEKSPLFLLIHGGPHAKDKSARLDLMAQYIASHGIKVLQVNYPGSTGSSKSYEEFSNGNWHRVPAYLWDAVQWSIDRANVDEKQVVVGGVSFGATAAMDMLTQYPGKIKGAVAINGVYDYVKAIEEARGYMDKDKFIKSIHDPENTILQLGGDSAIPEQKVILAERSVYSRLDGIEGWSLLFSGEKDTNCLPRQTADLAKALHKNGQEIRHISFEGKGHSLENVDAGGKFDPTTWEVVASVAMQKICTTFGIPFQPLGNDYLRLTKGAKILI